MYTELVLGVDLKKDTPENVINVLKYMLGDLNDKTIIDVPQHALFTPKTRWDFMLRCDSYYFDGLTDHRFELDDIDEQYHLNIRCNFKNYDNEIELFLDWIKEYLHTTGFLGYYRYEEFDDPTLIYNDYGDIEYKNVPVVFRPER